MKKVNLQDYAIFELTTSRVGRQFFAVKRSDSENKELKYLPSIAVCLIDNLYHFEREDALKLDRDSLRELLVVFE